MSRSASSLAVLVTVWALMAATPVSAQVLGTFRWQFAPYCNTVTLTIQQVGGQFTASGFDDLCGANRRAPASGTAHLNPDGTIGLGITVIRPDGFSVQLVAVFTPTSPTGTWRDDFGNSGTFAFGAPSPSAGAPRPVTLRGTYGARGHSAGATVNFAQILAPISFGRTLPFSPVVRFVAVGGTPPAECAGTTPAPRAAPGFLCVFETSQNNRQTPVIFSPSFVIGAADPVGALLVAANTTSGIFGSGGTWAVTVP